MFEYSPDHLAVIYRTDDPHFPLTLWADQWINLVYLLNQSCPAFPECLFASLWFKDAGDSVIFACFLPFSPCDVAVISLVPHHLFAPIRNVRTHGRKPLHSGKDLVCLSVLACIDDRPLLFQIFHPFLGGT